MQMNISGSGRLSQLNSQQRCQDVLESNRTLCRIQENRDGFSIPFLTHCSMWIFSDSEGEGKGAAGPVPTTMESPAHSLEKPQSPHKDCTLMGFREP